MNTGELIRKIRKSRMLSQRDLAKLLGISPAAVAQLEGRENCGVETLVKAAKACGYKMEIKFTLVAEEVTEFTLTN